MTPCKKFARVYVRQTAIFSKLLLLMIICGVSARPVEYSDEDGPILTSNCRECYPTENGVSSLQYKNDRFQASDAGCCGNTDTDINNRKVALLNVAEENKIHHNATSDDEQESTTNKENNTILNNYNKNKDHVIKSDKLEQKIRTKHDFGAISRLIDLLTVFRLTQLKELQKFLSDSVATAQKEREHGLDGQRHEKAAQRFHMERSPAAAELRNKSVDAIEHIFRSLVSNKQVQRLWCDKKRDSDNCSLSVLWNLFNMTLSKTPHRYHDIVDRIHPVIGNSTVRHVTHVPRNATLAGNITVELTVRMDGKKIGNVEMAKSYYKSKGNTTSKSTHDTVSSLLSTPYEISISDGLTDDQTGPEVPGSNMKKVGSNEDEGEWSDKTLDEHNENMLHSNAIFDELLELDPALLSESLFDEKETGWDNDAFVSFAGKSNTSSNASVVLFPEPAAPEVHSTTLLHGDTAVENHPEGSSKKNNSSSSSSSNIKIDGNNNNSANISTSRTTMLAVENSTTATAKPTATPNAHSSNAHSTSASMLSMLEETIKSRDHSGATSKASGTDKNEFIDTISQLFHLLLSNKTLQVIQKASSTSANINLQDRYYNHIIDLLQVLKLTLSQLENPHDKGTESLLLTTLKQLVKTITTIDSSYTSPITSRTDRTRMEDRKFTSRSTFSRASASLFSKMMRRPQLHGSDTSPRRGMASYRDRVTPTPYGELGDATNQEAESTINKFGISVDELKQLMPLL